MRSSLRRFRRTCSTIFARATFHTSPSGRGASLERCSVARVEPRQSSVHFWFAMTIKGTTIWQIPSKICAIHGASSACLIAPIARCHISTTMKAQPSPAGVSGRCTTSAQKRPSRSLRLWRRTREKRCLPRPPIDFCLFDERTATLGPTGWREMPPWGHFSERPLWVESGRLPNGGKRTFRLSLVQDTDELSDEILNDLAGALGPHR